MASFDKAIPPGQEGKITLKANTTKRKGKFSKSAKVYSNDPENPQKTITLKCTIKEYISVTPHNRIQLFGYEGDKLKEMATITSFEKQPLEITDITSTVDDKIKYKLKTKKKGKLYALEVKNRSTQQGTFNGKIVLKTSSQKKPHIIFDVNGRLKQKVSVQPRTLYFGSIDISKDSFNVKKLTKKMKLKDARGNGFTIKKIKPSSKWIKIEEKVQKENNQYTINVTLDKDKLPKGKIHEKINIYTSYKGKPLVVDVKGNVI